MTNDNEQRVADLVSAAVEICAVEMQHSAIADARKPRLLIEHNDPHRTVAAMGHILAENGQLYERGAPVRLVKDQQTGAVTARPVTSDSVVMLVHKLARPFVVKTKDGKSHNHDARLPKPIAQMYLDWHGAWNLPRLSGIASAPLLRADGSIFSSNGYDATTGFYLENVADVAPRVPQMPTRTDALAALAKIRAAFATFCFADAPMVSNATAQVVVDHLKPPACDESGFLAALLSAVCRPSLDLAPGFLIRAPQFSGSGSGKGLLARSICRIAYGCEPHAVTNGQDVGELEKRIAAELIAGGPALFLDNLNGMTFKSNLLASAITERPARVRVLGKSEMLPLNATAFVVLTGNALSVSEDLIRRFIVIELDPRMEDPETRSFPVDLPAVLKQRRVELLAAALTIWRWGRLHPDLPRGRPLGSFEQWSLWVRDPLVALECRDPVERLIEAKQNDGHRQELLAIFRQWHQIHDARAVTADSVHQSIKDALNPQKRDRQFFAAKLAKLEGVRVGGFLMTRQKSPGKWSGAGLPRKKWRAFLIEFANQRSRNGQGQEQQGARDRRRVPQGSGSNFDDQWADDQGGCR